MTDQDDWRLTFHPLAHDAPIPIRIRHLLKRALRDWGLKCTKIEGPEPGFDPDPTDEEE